MNPELKYSCAVVATLLILFVIMYRNGHGTGKVPQKVSGLRMNHSNTGITTKMISKRNVVSVMPVQRRIATFDFSKKNLITVISIIGNKLAPEQTPALAQ